MERRSFLKMSAAVTAAATITGCNKSASEANVVPPPITPTDEVINWSACLVNCGSNCPIKVFSKDGVITRIETDHETTDEYGVNQQVRACARGRSLRQRTYATDRLRSPMKRVGKRGEAKFIPITWEQAYSEIGSKLQSIKENYGPESILMHYGSGAFYGFASNNATWDRLLNLNGGFLKYHWDYSLAGAYPAAIASYGDQYDCMFGTSLREIANSDLFIGFGFNPNEIRMSGSGEGYDFIKQLKNNKKNIKVWMIDPRYTDSMRGNEDEWLAIRPGTDAALIEAIIYQMINSGWVDQNAKAFLDKYAVGYDKASLVNTKASVALNSDSFIASHAQYIDPEQNYHDYIMGQGAFELAGAKTPKWAAGVCGIPPYKIEQLATAIMAAEAPYISAGIGISRHANGDQSTRAVYTLCIMTGKIGRAGVNSGAMPSNYGFRVATMPTGTNPVDVTIPVFTWSDAVVRGKEFTGTTDGVRFTASYSQERVDNNPATLSTNIKAIINSAGNALVNQHSDSNGTAQILQNESNCELIIVNDCWMTPSAKFADYLLPSTTWLESVDYADDSYASGEAAFATFMSSSLTPLGESQSMYDICSGIAKAMGCGAEFTEGLTGLQWCEKLYKETKSMNPDVDMPDTYEEAQKIGVIRKPYITASVIAFESYIQDPVANPRPTISGKFEIYSLSIARKAATWTLPDGDVLTPLPQYVVTWEGYQDQEAIDAGYPLQLCGHHTKGRTHSSYHNVAWLREAVEDAVWMNPNDASTRGLSDGDIVHVYNERGTIELPVKVTPRVIPGVCSLGQGAWYKPDPSGKVGPSGHVVDIGGCINTLTKYHPSPDSKGNPQHTNRVQVVKA
ncbi:molybdopterin-dependent oxidoreductase [Shewanella chilikensis]|uniref:Surface localized dimethyl sulfoxide reductase, molybdopterin-binding subunit, DmsA n=1 Tax=Shewanella putrefaciens (strain 200) TaxID=399804 RepID=E6XKW4_SHEP2|nr:DMSO/selenate family reductase complex A subunit [Shewanella chilikensis]MCL1164349.1 molybdopterin-dependent oxidoreductase [Shewanella chilikensis]